MAGTVVICFTDIVDSTQLLSRIGDEAFDEVRRRHFEALERQVDAHGGEVVKSLGDGLMTAFGSASDAVSAGVAMQRAVHAASRSETEAVSVRVGISAGDATQEEDGDWFGTPVVESARLCSAAASGQILVSEVVRLLAGSRGGHDFRSVGTLELKGLPEPVGAAEVVWTPAAATLAVPLPGPLAPDEGELPFSGRADALEELRVQWKAAAAGERRVVMIAGEPGVGKTRLVSELARAVHADGALVLLGRTDEHVDAPYGPWREALRALVRSAPDEVIERHVAEHRGELARIVPDLERRVEGLAAPVATDPETERLLLFEAVSGFLADASTETPVLLVLDDLHWADRSSLQLLFHVLRADAPAALLVMATYRDTDLDRAHPLSTTLADLRRQRGASRLALTGIDGEGMNDLLAAAGGHDLDDAARAFSDALWRETEGNPFFVGEVLRHLTETGGLVQDGGRWRAGASFEQAGLPEGVREVIGRRLEVLPEATNAILGVASVIGREFDVSLVAEVAEEPIEGILEALEPAERARLISETPSRPGRYTFAHALVRTVLIDELGTNRRVRLHRAAGIALESQTDPPLGELAYHFGEAAVMGETERAVGYLSGAAEQALELAAAEDAVTLARRALEAADLGRSEDTTRARLLLLLGRALDATGEFDDADVAVTDAFTRAVAGGDVDGATAAAIEYGGLGFLWRGYGDEHGPAQLRVVLDLLPPGDSTVRARVLARLGIWLMSAPGDEGARVAREAYDMAVRVDDPVARQAAASGVAAMARSLDPREQLTFSEEAVALRAVGGVTATLEASMSVAEARLALGDLVGVDRAIVERAAVFDTSGIAGLPSHQTAYRIGTGGVRAVQALIRGDLEEVEHLIDELEDLPAANPASLGITTMTGRVQIRYLRGDWAGASEVWEEVRRVGGLLAAPYFGYVGTGSPLARARAHWEEWSALEPLFPEWTKPASTGVIAETLRRLEARDASAQLLAKYADHAGTYFTNSTSWFYGPFDTALGILAMTAGVLDDAVMHLTNAVARCEDIDSPTFGAIARLELATALRVRDAAGDEERAASASADARRLAERVGMPGWIERIDRLDSGDLEPWRIETA